MNLRWKLAEDEPAAADALFPNESVMQHHLGTGEYAGMEFLHVNAKQVINAVPKASRMPFRYTINAYRGCSHACSYCQSGETPILMGDGRTRRLAELKAGDEVYGSVRVGNYRRFVRTPVLDHWSTIRLAYRVLLEDGTELVASPDHRYLTNRGWKHVVGAEQGADRRPHLTTNNRLLGVGGFATGPEASADYRLGYLCGVLRGDGTIGHYAYATPRRIMRIHSRLALVDIEALVRARCYLESVGLDLRRTWVFSAATAVHRDAQAIGSNRAVSVGAVEAAIEWPDVVSDDWAKGFLAGIFDSEGSFGGAIRIGNADPELLGWTARCLERFRFRSILELAGANGVRNVRVRGGLQEVMRFFHTVDPAITRKMDISGRAIKTGGHLRVQTVEPLGIDMPMFDITTGTGDFIANGIVSHNCFARPTHDYLGLGIGEDFDRKIVVKVNAVERTRSEVRSRRWTGDHIAMGTNTDPYQKAEGKYHLTRGIVSVLGEARNPFSILTKSTLVLRDLDVLTKAATRTDVRLNLSIGTLDREVWRLTEPGTPPPDKRIEAVRRLNEAGIECGVLVAPVLPGLSDGDDQLREVVEACVAAGAVSISAISLHLRPGVREHYLEWLKCNRPDLLGLYEELFTGRSGPRAYQPKAVQESLSARVRELAHKVERPFDRPSVTRPPPDQPAEQLRLI